MATITERQKTQPIESRSSGTGFVVGVIIAVILGIILLAYAIPAIRRSNNSSIPNRVDQNINGTGSNGSNNNGSVNTPNNPSTIPGY